MNNTNNPTLALEAGATYMSNEGVPVTALKVISDDYALFVSEEFFPTPFVLWTYKLSSNNIIELYRGKYFVTLDSALSCIEQMQNRDSGVELKVYPYCPECGEAHLFYVELDNSAQLITEEIADKLVCPKCGKQIGAHKIAIRDADTYYELPLYHGPTD